MRFLTIHELRIVGIYDRGHPQRERIVLEITEELNLGDYCLIYGRRTANGTLRPVRTMFQSLPSEVVAAGTWVFLYTGPGERTETTTKDGLPALVLHFGREPTFKHPESSVAVLAISGITLAP